MKILLLRRLQCKARPKETAYRALAVFNDFAGFNKFDDGLAFKEINPEGYVEGPFMFVRNGKYYFMGQVDVVKYGE